MENLSFEQLPNVVNQIQLKLNVIERLLLENNNQSEEQELLTVEQCAEYLNLSKPTIYGLMSKNDIPYMKKGKRCYFCKAEILDYIKSGRRKTNAEIESETDLYLIKKGGQNV